MNHTYGICQSWVHATKVFGKHLLELPENQPVEVWPIADNLMQQQRDLAKTLIKDFINHDALVIVEKAEHFEGNKYEIVREALDEFAWPG